MCGIGVLVGEPARDFDGSIVLKRRGPDDGHVVWVAPTLAVQATVLHMRGSTLTPQPVTLSSGGVFCWNGEVYQMMDQHGREVHEASDSNVSDTKVLTQALDEALQQGENSDELQTLTGVMNRVMNGEFAFCYATEKYVYYGRDVWGRRSLLFMQDEATSRWRLSSVASDTTHEWTEVPPGRIYQYNVVACTTESLPLQLETSTVPTTTLTTSNPVSPLLLEKPPHVSQSMWRASLQLQELLTVAVERRCCCYRKNDTVGILFSGGLDSVVLAALTAHVLDDNTSIDLINVSFEKSSADRQAAIQSYEELQSLYPARTFRLVCVEADWDDIVHHQERIEQLMYPKHTTMDLNISTALWFAARGKGVLFDTSQPYHSACRILLLGMGADEQMAGYGRHRKYAQREGVDRLRQELEMDMNRLWERNLGRDDRLVSDHGKEARFPYLDAMVVQFLTSLPLHDICNFSFGPGVGDKQILRLIARRLGLETASGLVKRAIQFGSRIAHVSDKRRFGSRRKATGESRYKTSSIESLTS